MTTDTNSVALSGRLGRVRQLRIRNTGRVAALLQLDVQGPDKVEEIEALAWDGTAEKVLAFSEGAHIELEGRLSRSRLFDRLQVVVADLKAAEQTRKVDRDGHHSRQQEPR